MSEPLQAALPKEMYVDEAHWLRERDRVLFGEWFCVGRRDDLGLASPRRVAVVDVVGESVLLTSDELGVLHGAYNVCRHRGSQLVPARPGECVAGRDAAALRCPYHSWTYDLSGALLKAPHTEGVPAEEFGLHRVGVDAHAGFVFVHLDPHAARGPGTNTAAETSAPPALVDSVGETLSRLAGYGLDNLATGLTMDYDVAANYKVVAENYNECYHCGPVHPELCRLVPEFAGGGSGLDWSEGIPHRDGAWTFTMTGTTEREPLPGLSETERTRHKGELVYPNLMLSCSADHVAAFVLLPQSVGRTRIECHLLFAAEEVGRPGFDPSDAGDLWDLVNRQDWAVCESVQRGMGSRAYRHGWFAPMEDDSADIRRWLLPRLEGAR